MLKTMYKCLKLHRVHRMQKKKEPSILNICGYEIVEIMKDM